MVATPSGAGVRRRPWPTPHRTLHYCAALTFSPSPGHCQREPFEAIPSSFPRRFQVRGETGDQVAAGEAQFARKCSVCHTLQKDGANRAGPTLHGVFGRKIGTLPGYPYSDALKRMDIVWNEETISKLFELGPDDLQ